MCQTSISHIEDMDEISSTCSSSHKKSGKHIEPRKIRKPLMEKKRRARINQSLDELKRIVVDAEKFAGQDLSRVNKLEKADILEMTVRYLKRKTTPSSGADVYLAGYKQCLEQVQELLAEQWSDERQQQSGRRMVEHLETCVQRLNIPQTPQPKIQLLSSDESNNHMVACNFNRLSGLIMNFSSSSSSDDDESIEEDLVTTTAINVKQSTNQRIQFQDTPSKSMWRPW